MNVYNFLLLVMAPICNFSAVSECHQAPDADCFVLIKLPALVHRPTRKSLWLFATNQTVANPFPDQSG